MKRILASVAPPTTSAAPNRSRPPSRGSGRGRGNFGNTYGGRGHFDKSRPASRYETSGYVSSRGGTTRTQSRVTDRSRSRDRSRDHRERSRDRSHTSSQTRSHHRSPSRSSHHGDKPKTLAPVITKDDLAAVLKKVTDLEEENKNLAQTIKEMRSDRSLTSSSVDHRDDDQRRMEELNVSRGGSRHYWRNGEPYPVYGAQPPAVPELYQIVDRQHRELRDYSSSAVNAPTFVPGQRAHPTQEPVFREPAPVAFHDRAGYGLSYPTDQLRTAHSSQSYEARKRPGETYDTRYEEPQQQDLSASYNKRGRQGTPPPPPPLQPPPPPPRM